MTSPSPSAAYTGADNLEVMREAENYNRYLLDLIARYAPDAGTIVDFGAGSGTFAAPNRARGWNLTAVEPDRGLRAQLDASGVPSVADVEALADGSISYAYSLNVLEHIEDDVGALRALNAKLEPEGRVLIYVPAFPILYTSMDAKVGHVRRYTRRSLLAAVRAAGFSVQHARYADSLGFLATLVFKLVDRGRGDINRRALVIYDRIVFPLSRAIDTLAGRWFGKNLWLVATKGTR